MVLNKSFLVINNVKLSVNASQTEAFSVARKVLKKIGLSSYATGFSVFKRSIDARKKPIIYFVYSIAVSGDFPDVPSDVLSKNGITIHKTEFLSSPEIGNISLLSRPIVVGSGPCGLFAALVLAENGYRPIILERGGSMEERQKAAEVFNKKQILDADTNIQFGAGGAGTFSDGKLVTRINDPLTNYVIEKFIEHGAPGDIRYIAKPHVGTDILSNVVSKMIDSIIEKGGEILYHTKFLYPIARDGRVTSVMTSIGEIPCGALVIATGHSARDTYTELLSRNFNIEAKPFSVGMRIEHLSEDIDRALYGDAAGSPGLGRGEYALSHNTKQRGTYTFCMCPGGIVVAAASEDGGVVVNGMSYHSRSGVNSNSAVVTSIFKEDYGGTPTKAIEFQREIERRAFLAGGKDYSAPIITLGDFLSGELKRAPKRIVPSYMNGINVKLARPESYLPNYVCDGIKSAILDFDRKISGFASQDAVLTGAETRTSAPVRIIRDSETRLATGFKNIFPSGEGAGYAGGITSAAVDGVRSAYALMKIFKPNN